ncbi:MAG: helix-turn-helix domain-containing protein [Pseudonocardiales bacterium]|nr:helix-turn-helix domain-containing protein [Pseudonocardiales bacterium]
MNNRYMTTAEVAELLRTSPETVRYWRHVGKGPGSFRVGRKVLYERNDVESWLRDLRAAEVRAA